MLQEAKHTLLALAVLKELHALKGSGTANQLMAEAALMLLGVFVSTTLLVNLLVGIFGFSYDRRPLSATSPGQSTL